MSQVGCMKARPRRQFCYAQRTARVDATRRAWPASDLGYGKGNGPNVQLVRSLGNPAKCTLGVLCSDATDCGTSFVNDWRWPAECAFGRFSHSRRRESAYGRAWLVANHLQGFASGLRTVGLGR